MARPRFDRQRGIAALEAWRADPGGAARGVQADAVRYSLAVLEEAVPGHAVEVRVPPFGAVQCVPGPRHTRGTPPAVVETSPETWLSLVLGQTAWLDSEERGDVRASGVRSDLTDALAATRDGLGIVQAVEDPAGDATSEN